MLDNSEEEIIRDGQDVESKDKSTYFGLLKENRAFRLYLVSYLLDHMGEWFTYVASISSIEEMLQGEMSRTAISFLIVVRIAPHVLFSTIGGVVADSSDRRVAMMRGELMGSAIALLFIVAYYCKSIGGIYWATFLQECNCSLYEPNRSSIVPLMVTNKQMLQKATTLSGLAWSVMAAFGAGFGGFTVAVFGIWACYLLDSLTFLFSALAMWMVGGEWKSVDEKAARSDSIWIQICGMALDGYKYLISSFFGALVLLKFSAACVYGAADVLNVSFSEKGGGNSTMKLGMLFSSAGLGCIIGPLIMERFTDMKRIGTLQLGAIISLVSVSLGSLLMGLFPAFGFTCLFSVVRSAGSSALWINASLLLQTFSAPQKLGRVLSIDWSLAVFAEAVSAVACGILQDNYGLTPEQVSVVMAGVGCVLTIFWGVYHCSGQGAARKDISQLLAKSSAKPEATDEHFVELRPLFSSSNQA